MPPFASSGNFLAMQQRKIQEYCETKTAVVCHATNVSDYTIAILYRAAYAGFIYTGVYFHAINQ